MGSGRTAQTRTKYVIAYVVLGPGTAGTADGSGARGIGRGCVVRRSGHGGSPWADADARPASFPLRYIRLGRRQAGPATRAPDAKAPIVVANTAHRRRRPRRERTRAGHALGGVSKTRLETIVSILA